MCSSRGLLTTCTYSMRFPLCTLKLHGFVNADRTTCLVLGSKADEQSSACGFLCAVLLSWVVRFTPRRTAAYARGIILQRRISTIKQLRQRTRMWAWCLYARCVTDCLFAVAKHRRAKRPVGQASRRNIAIQNPVRREFDTKHGKTKWFFSAHEPHTQHVINSSLYRTNMLQWVNNNKHEKQQHKLSNLSSLQQRASRQT